MKQISYIGVFCQNSTYGFKNAMMLIKIVAFGLVFFLNTSAFAQEMNQAVFSSSGGESTGANYDFSYTVGEVVIDSYLQNSVHQTTGFNQPIAYSFNAVRPQNEKIIGLYPNPNNGFFNLSLNFDYDYISIVNLLGEEVFKRSNRNDEKFIPFNLSKLSAGSYYMVIKGDENLSYERIIISK